MQNPSQGVAQPLQNHVHLISGHRYPLMAHLSLQEAFRHLLDAPQIVKQIAPMSWTYVQAPQDGTLWLEWLSQDRGDNRFPSDGYVWADPEQTYRQEFNGYTVETMVHNLGYRPQYDQVASHARTRYHFIAKNPSVNAANPDASLWIVHYHQTEPGRVLAANQIPPNPQMSQIINERRWLEGQGKLERKDFMLHDRMQWPTITVPTGANMQGYMRQPGFYGAQPNIPNRQPVYAQNAGWPQQPANKKMRMSGPQHMPGASDAVHDTTIEDEENTALGDFFDHLTPRDISLARYTQHHRWMEEVFSSPYASSQIVPVDLGLGLMGELKGLTDGILEPPSMDFAERQPDKTTKPKEPQPFTNLSTEQLEEFNKRVTKHLEEGQAEIERMKAEHAAKMAEWKKTKTLMQAEKRLRYATWEGHESAIPAYPLEDSVADGHAEEGGPKETVDEVVHDVEGLLGVKISSHKEANMIEQGGLEKEEEQPQVEATQDGAFDQQKAVVDEQQQQQTYTASGGQSQPTMYHQEPALVLQGQAQAQDPQPKMPSDIAQTNVQPEQQQQPTQPQPTTAFQPAPQDAVGDLSTMDMNDTSMMDDMDMDVNDSTINFDDTELSAMPDESLGVTEPIAQPTAQAPGEQTSANVAPAAAAQQAATSSTLGSTSVGATQQHQHPQQQAQPSATQEGAMADGSGAGEGALTGAAMGGDSADAGMFNDSTFDDFTNMDEGGEGDDGLIDFEGGGMGMDESAFGDALHGMEQPEGGEEAGEGESA